MQDEHIEIHLPIQTWMLIASDCVECTQPDAHRLIPPLVWHLVRDEECKDLIPLFTEKAFGEQYIVDRKLGGKATLIAINDHNQLLEYLGLIDAMTTSSHVVINPVASHGQHEHVWPTDYVKAQLCANLPLSNSEVNEPLVPT